MMKTMKITAAVRNNLGLSLALGFQGQSAEAARVARVDRDDAETKDNLSYFDIVRGLPKSSASSPGSAGS